ncbi:MAG: DotH/IcmK family type IV secretion protein [Deltaproteobacteria bacterium]|jgi:intracellular multiplication protein IcmK|nr:DotH/IcmK family type IV secretion protein [Deltaproteobacteria bacterium]
MTRALKWGLLALLVLFFSAPLGAQEPPSSPIISYPNGTPQGPGQEAQKGQGPPETAALEAPTSSSQGELLVGEDSGAGEKEVLDASGAKEEEASLDAHQEAFERSLAELMPVTPEEITKFRKDSDKREKAASDSPPSGIRTRTVPVSLDPGFAPPLVELTPNLVTALVFLDTTGSPWPITASVLGSGKLFEAQVLEGGDNNRIIVSALSSHGNSNLIVTLEGHDIPLVLRLETRSGVDANRRIDGLLICQVQARGPKALPQEAAQFSPLLDGTLYSFLDGLVPKGARAVSFVPSLEGISIYDYEGRLYIRTKSSLLWPAFKARVIGASGYAVYETESVPSLLISLEDEIKRLTLSTYLDGEVLAKSGGIK